MTTPTPGPWKINKQWGTIEGPRSQEICAIHPADESGRREPRATAQANARLIASAPELLDALKAYYTLDPRCHHGVTHCGDCPACKAAELIARIERN